MCCYCRWDEEMMVLSEFNSSARDQVEALIRYDT